MKTSKYNIFFNSDNVEIGYNSYSNEFIILNPTLYDLYNVALKQKNFDELNDVHPEFYNFLIQQGFLVEENLDEFELIKQQSIRIDNDDSEFRLIVNPTMNCNFKCWYCYETHIKDSKMDENTIMAINNLASNIIQNQKGLKHFNLTFFGGEPLLYFDKVIKKILACVSDLCKSKNVFFYSSMTTNGLLINQEMLEICKIYVLNGFQITLDGNRERHDKVRFISEGRGSYDKIISNILLIVLNKLHVNIRINCSKETMEDVSDIMNEFNHLSENERKYIQFDLHKVWQEQEQIDNVISDTRFFFRENGYSVSGEASGTVVDSCYADKRYQATINYNGEVFKCTARDFKDNSGEGILNNDGTIVWNEKYEKRLSSKFKNAPCKECCILPICGGGCTQIALENAGVDYCVHNFDEDAKTQVVINKFKEILLQ